MNNYSTPLVSIITVVYNDVVNLEATIISVISQIYPNIEYIIIDGGSSDGTIDIIEKYSNKISYWISEPDNGIYDAMNKGIKQASGEWINFMNSGDTFASNDVIDKVFRNQIADYIKVIYGSVYIKKGNLIRLKKPYKLSFIKRHIPFCHQSSFVLNKYFFDTNYKIAADYKMMYDIFYYHGAKAFLSLDKIAIAIYECENGVSLKQERTRYYEYLNIRSKSKDLLWIYELIKGKIKDIFKLW